MVTDCTAKYFDSAKLQAYYSKNCNNTERCNISLISFLYKNSSEQTNECTNDGARVYLNLQCNRTMEQLKNTRTALTIITQLVVLASIVFYFVLFFFHKHLENKRSFYYSK